MWDNVPWFVGGGAVHSPEVARLLAYAATGGVEGVVSSTDCKVVALATPGASVRVLTGATLVLNRAQGGSQQTYVGRLATEDVLPVAATGSGSGRNDLVVARVEDPFVAGSPYQAPTDVTSGPYIFSRVISNVPASAVVDADAAKAYLAANGISATPLAGIILPASTATITNGSMIRDLRTVARPRKERVQRNSGQPPVGQANTAVSFAPWISPATWAIPVPSWASRAVIRIDVINAIHEQADVFGTLGLFMGSTLVASGPYAEDWNGASTRSSQIAANDITLDPAVRGTTQTFTLNGLRSSASGYLTTDAQTRVLLDIEFIERAA